MKSLVRRAVRRWSTKNRERRWETLRNRIAWHEVRRILDLGGKPEFWERSGLTNLPIEVLCLNLAGGDPGVHHFGAMRVELVRADATEPPVDPAAFDLVFSNSVIEHVGGLDQIKKFAAVLRSGDRYFVQTPSRYFLVEPHLILPFHYLLPRFAKVLIVMFWDKGPHRRTLQEAQQRVDSIHLLTRRDMEMLFPDGDLLSERRWLQTKSFMVFGPLERARLGPAEAGVIRPEN